MNSVFSNSSVTGNLFSDKAYQVAIVKKLILGLLIFTSLLFLISYILSFFGYSSGPIAFSFVPLFPAYYLAYLLCKKGKTSHAGYIISATLFVVICLIDYKTGIGHASTFGYAILILTSGLLIGIKTAAVFAFLSTIFYSLLGLLQLNNHLEHASVPTEMLIFNSIWMLLSLLLLIFINWLGRELIGKFFVAEKESLNELNRYKQRLENNLSELEKKDFKLKKSETDYKNLFENAHDSIILFRKKDDVVMDVNQQATYLYGYEKEEFIGMSFLLLTINPLKDKNELTRIIKGNSRQSFESIHQTKEGGEIFIEGNASTTFYKGEEVIIMMIRDITDKKKAEEEFYRQQAFFQQLFESSPQGIAMVDKDDLVIKVNKGFENIFHFEEEEARGRNINDLITPKEKKNEAWNFSESVHGKEIIQKETVRRRRDGTQVDVSIIGYPIIVNNEQVGIYAIYNDITERKRIERELLAAKEDAEKSDKLKSEFLAQMSHEIRTPLNSILCYTSLLKSEAFEKISDELKFGFDIIENGGHRLIRTIDSIINMSEIQTNSFECKYENLFLKRDVLSPLFENFKEKAKRKTLDFEIISEIQSDIAIVGDRYTLDEIFSNLIDNAIKYTSEGHVRLIIKQHGHKVSVEVEDSGVGIKEEYMPNLFAPFTQEEQGYCRKYEGNGLGLALVKKYCEMNGANIEVESEKGKGSLFRVSFIN